MLKKKGINDKASIKFIEKNKIVEDHVEVSSRNEENHHVHKDNTETMENENEIEVLEVVKETFNTETKSTEVIYDDRYLSENDVTNNTGHEVDNDGDLSITNDIESDAKIAVRNIQGNENKTKKLYQCMHCQSNSEIHDV